MKWKSPFCVAVAVLVIGLGFLAVNGRMGSSGVTPKPSAGQRPSFVRLVSVKVGTNFSYRVAPSAAWEKRVLKLLPASLGSHFDAWLGMGSGALSMASYRGFTNLAVFTATDGPSGQHAPEALFVLDEEGNPFLAAQGASTIGSDDGQRFRALQGWVLQAFPRRAKRFRLQLMREEASSWIPVASFQISNPLFSQYPTWVAEPLPITKTNGDLSVTLTELATGVDRQDLKNSTALKQRPVTRLRFDIREAGQTSLIWQPKSIEISDATGNCWQPFILPEPLQPENGTALVFSGGLWPGETAWRLRLEFSRRAQFTPDELWTISGLEVPQADESIDLLNSVTNQGTTLRLVTFCGSDVDQPGGLKWLMPKGEPRISVRADNVPAGYRLSLVRVVDDQERLVEAQNGQEWGWAKGEKVFALKLPQDAARVSCTFALHRSRFVEFLARPSFPPSATK